MKNKKGKKKNINKRKGYPDYSKDQIGENTYEEFEEVEINREKKNRPL